MAKDTEPRAVPIGQLSCERCRRKKTRCHRPERSEASTNGTHPRPSLSNPLPPCITCTSVDVDCITDYERKKRGPAPFPVRRVKAQGARIPFSTPEPTAGSISRPETSPSAFSSPYLSESTFSYSQYGVLSIPAPEPSQHSHNRDSRSKLDHSLHASSPHGPQNLAPKLPQLEDVIPRDTAIYIISLHFHYMYPLVPCLHRPSFMKRLNQREDHQNPLFYALVMSVLAASIVQIPKLLLPSFEQPQLDVARQCMRASRSVSVHFYDPPTLELVTIRYFDAVFNSLTRKTGSWVAAMAEALRLAILLNMHREVSYVGLDPIQAECRRRIIHILFASDKSAACMQDQLIAFRKEDFDTQPAREINDEFITETAYLEPPQGSVSVLTGFNVAGVFHSIIGEVTSIRRELSRLPSVVNATVLLSHLRHLNESSDNLVHIFDKLPAHLRLGGTTHNVSNQLDPSQSSSWETHTLKELNDCLSNLVSAPTLGAPDECYHILQGNIHATRAVARLITIVCREEIINKAGPAGSPSAVAVHTVISHTHRLDDSKESIVADLLSALRQIPIQALATNSHSLLNKIRFVAVTLIDSLANPVNFGIQGVSPEQEALLSFLEILTNIETNLVSDSTDVIP